MRPNHGFRCLPTFYPRLQVAQVVESENAVSTPAMIHALELRIAGKILRDLGDRPSSFPG